ncbi:MAG: 2OG-Fe(II) oxygenase [Kofleriaceae bacterium]|nr:2OG-Fe(II) oxygenase [Kofleriaceae bacterium]MBP6836648.1 2OG-Fe(II) oxygenase [Kofleriaceae bacterium]MBP9207362.1 2OG-Fe(II) oxygenase [Kofleriaceae bacterium]
MVARRRLSTGELAPHARVLRAEFDQRMADPRRASVGRFAWDWWHVPDQYTLLRAPAWTYFTPAAYQRFHRALVGWGRRVLGCHDVSPPWLSLYVDGCGQRLHGDLPHGPWAFVLSLTPWPARHFTGGQTLLGRDALLDYWTDFASTRAIEQPDLLERVPPRFGRLLVFDPRLPHGVDTVRGTQDPRHGRLVVNGWFVQPRPFVEGPLPIAAVAPRLAELDDVVARADVLVAGVLSLRIDIGAAGAVGQIQVLTDTTRTAAGDEAGRRRLVRALRRHVGTWRFPRRPRPSRLTLPLVFERG